MIPDSHSQARKSLVANYSTVTQNKEVMSNFKTSVTRKSIVHGGILDLSQTTVKSEGARLL